MIEFKTKYTEGPWVFDGCDIRGRGGLVVDGDAISTYANVRIILNSAEMAEYMMERAKFLHKKETEIQEEIANGNHDAALADMVVGRELAKILQILKDAGIEVVEESDNQQTI